MSESHQQQKGSGGGGAGFNPNAPSFVPNVRAPVFVPGQPYQQFQQPPPPQGALYQMPPQWMHQQMPPPAHPGGGVPPNAHFPPPPLGGMQQPPYGAPPAAYGGGGPFGGQHQQHNMGGGGGGGFQGNSHSAVPSQQAPPDSWDNDEDPEQDVSAQPTAPPTASAAKKPPSQHQQPPVSQQPVATAKESSPADQAPKQAAQPSSSSSTAQGKRPTLAPAQQQSAGAVGAEETEQDLVSKFKSNVVLDENRKERVNIVFVGHVDAGKSTIGGQLMYLTGMVDKRTLEKYEKEAKEKGRESWYLSWALDTNEEEREKGKTVEVGRAFFETEKKHFTILDAPGHKSFVPNMITGATQADLAVLVISARKGEFETGFDRGGQTREHAMLVKTAGVKHMVILVNKMDDPTVGWSQERYAEIQEKLNPYLRKCGYAKGDIKYIPCSGLSGAFLKERPTGEASWYTDECFLDYIDNMLPKMTRDFSGPVRAIVADKYSDMGTVIIGKMESGVIQKGQYATVMPNRTQVQVLQCWTNDVETDQVYSGDNVKLKLKGVEESDIMPGFVLCSPEAPCKVGRIFDAEVVILEYKSIIAAGYSCVLHLHAAVEEVSVKTVICTIDKRNGEKKKAKFVKQDDKCIMRLESPEAFCLECFKDFPQMGRFTLRDEGKTIAIGKVVKVVE